MKDYQCFDVEVDTVQLIVNKCDCKSEIPKLMVKVKKFV